VADKITKEEWEQYAEEKFSFPEVYSRTPVPNEALTTTEATPAENPYTLRRSLGSTGTSIDRDRGDTIRKWTTGDPEYQSHKDIRETDEEETRKATKFESLLHMLTPLGVPAAFSFGVYRDLYAKSLSDPDDKDWAEKREEFARKQGKKMFVEAREETLQTGLWDQVSGMGRGGSALRHAQSSLEHRYGVPEKPTTGEIAKRVLTFQQSKHRDSYTARLAAMAIQEEYGENIFELDVDKQRELMARVEKERPDIALVWDPTSRYPGRASGTAAQKRPRATVSRPKKAETIWEESPESVRDAYAQMGRQWYDALQSGAYKKEQYIGSSFPLIGPDYRMYGADRDVLEAAISPAEAFRMANLAESSMERIYWSDLATNSGRATYDIFSTILHDPFWFFGGAGGARVVSVGGKVYTTTKTTSRLIGTLDSAARLSQQPGRILHNDEILPLLIRLKHGTPEEVTSARAALLRVIDQTEDASKLRALNADELGKLLEGTSDDVVETLSLFKGNLAEVRKAREQARESLAAFNRGDDVVAPSVRDMVHLETTEKNLTRLITSLETQTGNWRKTARTAWYSAQSESRLYSTAADDLGSLMEDIAKGKHIPGIKQAPGKGYLTKGVVRGHIPFMENTYHLDVSGLASTLVSRGARVIPDSTKRVAANLIGDSRAVLDDLSLSNLESIVASASGRTADEIAKLPGLQYERVLREHLTAGQYTAAASQLAGGTLKKGGYFLHDGMAKIFGTTFMQPYMSSLRNAAHAEVLGGTVAADRVVSSFPTWAGGLWGAAGATALTALVGASPLGMGTAAAAGFGIGRVASPGKAAIKVIKLQKETWSKYQTAMGRYLQILNIRDAQIGRTIERLYRTGAVAALKDLKARKAAEQEELLRQKSLILRNMSEEMYLSNHGTLEETIIGNKRILSDSYDVQAAMLDVFSGRERGAGMTDPNSPFYIGDELTAVANKLKQHIDSVAEELKVPVEEAQEALLQLSQGPYGNYERYHAIQELLEELAKKRESGVLALEHKSSTIRKLFSEERQMARLFVEIFSDFPDNSVKQKKFIEALEAIRETVLDDPAGMPGNKQWIRQVIARHFDEVVPGEGGAMAGRVIQLAQMAFTEADAERAVRRLVVELSEANVRASRLVHPSGATLQKPSKLKLDEETIEWLRQAKQSPTGQHLKPRTTNLSKDDWEWIPLEPQDYEPAVLFHINRLRKEAGLRPIGTWDAVNKEWVSPKRVPGDGQITANSIRAAVAIRQSELEDTVRFLNEQLDAIIVEGQTPTAKEMALFQRNIDKLISENRRKAYALIGNRLWPHFEEWRRMAYPHAPNVRYSNPQTVIERTKLEILEATKVGDTDRVTALSDKLLRAAQRAEAVSFDNEPWLLGREEFLNFLENWTPDEVIPGFPEASPIASSKDMPFYSTPSFTEYRLAKRFQVTEYTEEALLEAAQRMLRHYEEKYGLASHKLVFERNGEESVSNAWGWIVRPHYKITLTEKTIDNGNFLTCLRHEIEHAIEYAMDPSFDPKRVRFLKGFATGGAADLSKPFIRKKLKDGTVADVITHIFDGHHKRYSAFELDYVRRELVRDALLEGKAVDPKVIQEAGVDPGLTASLSPLSDIYRHAHELLVRANLWEGARFDSKLARLPEVTDSFRKPSGHEASFYKALLQFAGDEGMSDSQIRAVVNLYDLVAISTSRGDAASAYDWWLRLGRVGPDSLESTEEPFEFLLRLLPSLYGKVQEVGAAKSPQRAADIQAHLSRVMQSLPKGTSIGDAFVYYLAQIAKTKVAGPNSPARAVIGQLVKHMDLSEVPPLPLTPTARSYFDSILGGLSPNTRSAQLEEVELNLKLIRQRKAKGVVDEIAPVPISGGVGHFTVENILNERLLTAVEDAKTPAQAITRVRQALKLQFPHREYPHLREAINKMAKHIGPALMKSSHDNVFQALANERKAIEQIVRRTKEEMDVTRRARKEAALGKISSKKEEFLKGIDEEAAALSKEAEEVRPLMDPPLSLQKTYKEWEVEDYIEVEKWQDDLVKSANKLMDEEGITSDKERLFLILTLFKDRPNLPKDMGEMYTNLANKFPRVHGNRMGDIDPELYPLMERLGEIITHFEEMMLKQGRSFIADQEHLMRTMGVTNYVPHMLAPGAITDAMSAREVSQKLKIGMEEMPTAQNRAAALESRFGGKLDGDNRRRLYGTIAEINARIDGKRTDLGAFTADPLALMGRYLQISDAMAADELMTSLLHAGVIRPISGRPGLAGEPGTTAAAVANELDMVPLFQRGVPEASARSQRIMSMMDDEALFTGDAAQIEAMWQRIAARYADRFPEEIGTIPLTRDDFIDALKAYRGGMEADGPLAIWLRDVPELKKIQETEDMILSIRTKQYEDGLDLYNPRPKLAEIQNEINTAKQNATAAADEAALAKKEFEEFVGADPIPDALRTEMDEALRRYNEAIESFDAVAAWAHKEFQGVADEINTLYHDLTGGKITYKVTASTLFDIYAGNSESWKLYMPRVVHQSMRDILEVGEITGGVKRFKGWLDRFQAFYKIRLTVVSTAFTARNFISNNMSNILDLGPLGALNPKTNVTALQISTAVHWYEGYGNLNRARKTLQAPKRLGESDFAYKTRQARAASFEMHVGHMLENGVDLGDGIRMHPDDAIARLKEQNVLSETFTQYVDIDLVERQLLESLKNPKKGAAGTFARLGKAASTAEDMVFLTLPFFAGAPLVALPKAAGAAIARTVENQGRLCNFIGNMRRSGNWSESAAHVNKFLFDYNDLTAVQRTWLRTIFPFFTWNIKNIHLQMEMLAKNPVFYSQFRNILLDKLPRALRADEDPYSMSWYMTAPRYLWSKVRLPIPGTSNAYVSGFGTPQEAFVEWGGPFLTLFNADNWRNSVRTQENDAVWRFLGHSNFAARLIAEQMAGKKAFQNIPIGNMTNGRTIYGLMQTLQSMGLDQTADMVRVFAGLHIIQVRDPVTGLMVDRPIVMGGANNALASSPWSRFARDMSKMGTAYNTALAADMFGQEYMAGETTDEFFWRFADSYFGIGVRYYDPHAAYRSWDKRLNDRWMDIHSKRGDIGTFTKPYEKLPKEIK